MNNIKFYKKGEFLFKEGDRVTNIFIIQSGSVSVFTVKNKKNVEIFRANTGQVIGEEALGGALQYTNSAAAIGDTNVIEFPAPQISTQVESLPQLLKLILKSQVDRIKLFGTELKNIRLEQEVSLPCPPEGTAKVYGVIYHLANYSGVKKDGKVTINWPAFKKYAQRVFAESPLRLEQAMYVLVKLKLAELQMVKNETDPDAPDELGFFHILNLPAIEKFFEFYQHFFFRAGSGGQILKYDEKCNQTATVLLKLSENERVDQKGVVYMNYKTTLDKMKEIIGSSFTPDAIARLEQKGLFVKRDPNEKGGTISFFKPEFEEMLLNWKILKEIDKWNEKGSVDLNEDKPKPAAQAAEQHIMTCPQCISQIRDEMKFCPACGHKLKAA